MPASAASSGARPINRATHFGDAITLMFEPPSPSPANDSAPAREPCPEYRWIHCANAGTFRGHHQGEFTIDDEVLGQLVNNLRADPKYKRGKVTLSSGAIEAGCNPVVQYDYEHASEMAPWEGSIPATGAPACGWVLDLEVRKGADGVSQLWALSKLGPQIRGYIDRDEYRSVSIAWNPAGVHWVSGKPIGAVLTSIAFTNHPFIRDLEPLAAANRAAGQSGPTAVQSRAQSREAHHDSPPSTQGVSMSSPEQALRIALCSLFRLNPASDDASIIRAAENASSASNDLAGLLKSLGVGDPAAALAAVPDLLGARNRLAEMINELDALMRADAAADQGVAEQDVAAAMSARRCTDPQLVVAFACARGSAIESEIKKLPAAEQKDPAKTRLARVRGRTSFLQHYGVNTDPRTQHLSQTFVAGPGPGGASTQYLPPGAPGGYHLPQPVPMDLGQNPGYFQAPYQPQQLQPIQLSQPTTQQLQGTQGQTVDLNAYSGRNLTEKIMSYLASLDASFVKLPVGERVSRASAWRKANLPQQAAA